MRLGGGVRLTGGARVPNGGDVFACGELLISTGWSTSYADGLGVEAHRCS